MNPTRLVPHLVLSGDRSKLEVSNRGDGAAPCRVELLEASDDPPTVWRVVTDRGFAPGLRDALPLPAGILDPAKTIRIQIVYFDGATFATRPVRGGPA
jgi:hypothetical protein